MPFASKRQARWAFATGQPFAKRWAKQTNFAALPASKDAGTEAGAPLHGPGGLLATPGMGGRRRKKWGMRLKAKQIVGNLYRGDTGRFQAGGAPTPAGAVPKRGDVLSRQPTPHHVAPTAPKAPRKGGGGKKAGGGKGKAPTITARQQQRDAEHAQDRAQRQADRQARIARQAQRERDKLSADMQRAAAEAKKKLEAKQPKGGGGGGKKPSDEQKKQQQQAERSKRAASTARQVGLAAADVQALRTAAESGGAQSAALASLGLIGTDGMTTDQGRRALSALERGDVRGYNAALQDASARMGREAAAAQRRQQTQGARTRAQQERQARQQRQIDRLKRRAVGGAKLSTSEIGQLQDAGVIDETGRFKAASPGDYLVVEDPSKPSTYHLQVKRNGKLDHGLMGSAWAALHSGFRGNVYQGPDKGKALDKLKALYRAEKMELPTEKSFTVYKDASGRHRWIARTTTAYRDRDHEIIASDALDQDSQRMTATKQFGPLRYWHVGSPDPFDAACPWGPGLDIGDCDYSTLIGRTRIESGTFRDPQIAETITRKADQYELSPGFFHPLDQPSPDGVFSTIRTFERSLVPMTYGRASNLFTGLAVKEQRMDMDEMERRFKAAITDLGLDKAQALALGAQLVATEKDAAAQGIAYKSEDAPPPPPPAEPPAEITIGGVVYTVKAAPTEDAVIAEKAIGDVADESPMEDMAEGGIEEPEDIGGEDVIGNMTPAEFWAQLQQYLAPVLKMQDMVKSIGDMHSELKGMYGGVAQKDDARAAELTTLKAQLSELMQKIATIEGDQPSVVLPDEVEAALKSAGPATPTAPGRPEITDVVNDPNRPWAGWGMKTYPKLYEIPGTDS
jgi:hypothetical protein